MFKEQDRIRGIQAGLMKVLGAGTVVGADKLLSPALLDGAGKLAATGQKFLGNVEAGLFVTLHTPPELALVQGVAAGIVTAAAIEQVIHPPGESAKFWSRFSFLYGVAAMLEPNVIALAHQHPDWGGAGFIAWALAAITLVEASRIGWNIISRADQRIEEQVPVQTAVPKKKERYIITHRNPAKDYLARMVKDAGKPVPPLPPPASKEYHNTRFRNIMNDPSNKE